MQVTKAANVDTNKDGDAGNLLGVLESHRLSTVHFFYSSLDWESKTYLG